MKGKWKILVMMLVVLLAAFVPVACNTSTPPTSSTTDSTTVTSLPDKVDVLFFHSLTKWASCLWFEDSITRVVNDDFANDLNTGKITFGEYTIGDAASADIVKKFGAVGPQMFFDLHRGDAEQIVNAGNLYAWGCLTDKAGFEQKVEDAINKALQGGTF